jgi:predicted metalloprotease
MRWRDSRQSQNVEDYRGQDTARGVGGGGMGARFGIGTIIALVVAYFLGIDPRIIMGITQVAGQMQQPSAQQLPPAAEGAPADEGGDFVSRVLGDTEDTWGEIFRQGGAQYQPPKLVLFSAGITSGCGPASAAAGPFYCPADQKVYIDLSFYRQLETEFAAQGDFAKAYVLAHEVGHHVQTVLGTSAKVREAQQRGSQEAANALQVAMELQADCYAGIWAHHAEKSRQLLEAGDVEEALGAAAAVGDDTIQRRTTGHVNQESFTHGSAEQRKAWFLRGLQSGSMQACDTFNAR